MSESKVCFRWKHGHGKDEGCFGCRCREYQECKGNC